MYVYVHWHVYRVQRVIEGGRFLPANVHVGAFLCSGTLQMCVYCILFPVRICGSMEVEFIRRAGAAVGLPIVGSGLQGGSPLVSSIMAQMPLFIVGVVQLICAVCQNLWGNLTCYWLPGHVLSLWSAGQALKTNFSANNVFIFQASRDLRQ